MFNRLWKLWISIKNFGKQSNPMLVRLMRFISKHNADYLCSVCGNPYYDFDACKHLGGSEYFVKDADGKEKLVECYLIPNNKT